MNATSLDQIRTARAQRDAQDEKMEQIRELLIGDLVRQNETRFAAIEERLQDLEAGLSSRLAALHARLDALSGEVGAEHRTAFDELSRAMSDLSDRIRKISRP